MAHLNKLLFRKGNMSIWPPLDITFCTWFHTKSWNSLKVGTVLTKNVFQMQNFLVVKQIFLL